MGALEGWSGEEMGVGVNAGIVRGIEIEGIRTAKQVMSTKSRMGQVKRTR